MRRIFIGAVVVLGIVAALGHAPAHAAPAPYKGCIVFEDDSFVCGTLLEESWEDDGYASIDYEMPRVVGCIPDGVCDTPTSPETDEPLVQLVYPFTR